MRRLVAWAVLAGMAGIAVRVTPWAGILFGVTAFVTLVQAVFVTFEGDTAALPPGPPPVIGTPGKPGRCGAAGLTAALSFALSHLLLVSRRYERRFRVLRPRRGTVRAVGRKAQRRTAPRQLRPPASYQAGRLTSLAVMAAGVPAGMLLGALSLLPAYGSAGWLPAMLLITLGTAAFSGLMWGRYALLRVTELMLGGPGLHFFRLLEEAAERGVLTRSGTGYRFCDNAMQARVYALSRPDRAAPVVALRAGAAARLARVPEKTIGRIAADACIGMWAAISIAIFAIGDSHGNPFWLAPLLTAVLACYARLMYPIVKDTVGGIVHSARWRQQNIAGLGPLRGLILVSIGGGAVWMLVAAAGPDLADILARWLPAAFVAACGAWLCTLTGSRKARLWQWVSRALTVATVAAFSLVLFNQGMLTTQPAAALAFPPATWGAVSLWRSMIASERPLVRAGADLTLALALGAELVILLVWLANLAGLSRPEMVTLLHTARYLGSAASLPWWAWTGCCTVLALASLAFVRWPERLAETICRFEHLHVTAWANVTRRVMSGAHVGLSAVVFVGLAAPQALVPTLQRQLRAAYVVAYQRDLAAQGEQAAYKEIQRQFTGVPADAVLVSIVASIHDIATPGPGTRNATGTETDDARRVGEVQALALGATVPQALKSAAEAAANQAGFDGAPGGSKMSDQAARADSEQHESDEATDHAEAAGELAAAAIADSMSFPNISGNEVFQILWNYLSGLVEESPLSGKLAAWAGNLAGEEGPAEAAQEVVPVPADLQAAASSALDQQLADEGLERRGAGSAGDQESDESAVAAAVDLVNESRWLQEGGGSCPGCVRPPASRVEEPAPGEEPPPEHFEVP